MRFLHHACYFTYFEMAAPTLAAFGGNYRQMEEQGLRIVVCAGAECRFQHPARYDDVLRLRTTIARVTAAKI